LHRTSPGRTSERHAILTSRFVSGGTSRKSIYRKRRTTRQFQVGMEEVRSLQAGFQRHHAGEERVLHRLEGPVVNKPEIMLLREKAA